MGPFAVGVGVAAGVVDDTVLLLGEGGAVSLLDFATGSAGLVALVGSVASVGLVASVGSVALVGSVAVVAAVGLVAGFFGAYHRTKKIESKGKEDKVKEGEREEGRGGREGTEERKKKGR